MDVGESNGDRLNTGLALVYRLRMWGSYIRIARCLCGSRASCLCLLAVIFFSYRNTTGMTSTV